MLGPGSVEHRPTDLRSDDEAEEEEQDEPRSTRQVPGGPDRLL